MQSRLIIKNFGPLKQVDLDLANVNVFIGPQASGKSAIAKLYTIFKAPRKFLYKTDKTDKETQHKEFIEALDEYNIASFLKPDTEIKFESPLHDLNYKGEVLTYDKKIYDEIKHVEELAKDYDTNENEIKNKMEHFQSILLNFSRHISSIYWKENKRVPDELPTKIDYHNYPDLIDKIRSIENNLSANTALYIPAERLFSNIIKKSALNLMLNNVPIPKHIISFGAELEKIDIMEVDLGFITKDLKYKVVDGIDKIFTDRNNSINLSESASGIQSVIPILLSTMNRDYYSHHSLVIEEPELNLFPSAQYQLIQRLESDRREPYHGLEDTGTIHTYTTHSPYILSGMNNLLYAYKVFSKLLTDLRKSEVYDTNMVNELYGKVSKIGKALLLPKNFRAYQLKNGKATSIFDKKTGLIKDNYIDESTDKIDEDFEALMELTKK